MNTVLDADAPQDPDGVALAEAFNQSFSSFTPDMMFEQMVSDYKTARRIIGDSIIRVLSGYDPDYIEKNINIPEFQREVQRKMRDKTAEMNKRGIIDKLGRPTQQGVELAALTLAMEELDELIPRGTFGRKRHEKDKLYGSREESKKFSTDDRFRDINIKRSLKTALRRGHTKIMFDDLKAFEKESRGKINIIYAIDASGSMKGEKIKMAKKAGVALAYHAIEQRDKVGLIVFGDTVLNRVEPTLDFNQILKSLTVVRPAKETDIANTITTAIEMFSERNCTNHLILITDGLHTIGSDKDVLEQVMVAVGQDISVSVIGISLDDKGRELAEKIVEISKGKLYSVSATAGIDRIILEDYYSYS